MISFLSPWAAQATSVARRSMERGRAHITGMARAVLRLRVRFATRLREPASTLCTQDCINVNSAKSSDLAHSDASRGRGRHRLPGTAFAIRLTNVHIIAFVAGCTIVGAILWDAFETLVLPRSPMRRLRLTRLFYRATWRFWASRGRKARSDRQRERFLSVYGPLSVLGLLTLWASGLVVGFALLQWSQRELLLNLDGTA